MRFRHFTLAMLMVAVSIVANGQAVSADRQTSTPRPGPIRLVLPSTIYASPEIECNIYFDNVALMLNRHNYAFDVTCEKGLQFSERWAFTPVAEDVGEYSLRLEVRDEANRLVAYGETRIRVAVPGGARSEPKTLLIVGASFVEASIYPQHILDLSKKEGAVPLKLLGSRGAGNMPPTTNLRHEGYSGWTSEAFATMSGPLSRSGYHNRPGTGSPFLYPSLSGTQELDFARYCDEFNGGDPPSFVTIDLGGNDVFYTNDETIDAAIDRMFQYYDAVVDAIRRAAPRTRIGVLASTPPSTSQDGFRNYLGAGKKTQWQFHRNIHRLVERKIEHYDNRTDERIYLVPTYVNLDTEHHFPTSTAPRNHRSSETSTRVSNGTHPSPAGYQQIGDSVYAWIVASMPPQ